MKVTGAFLYLVFKNVWILNSASYCGQLSINILYELITINGRKG